jgi:hypothetical protein
MQTKILLTLLASLNYCLLSSQTTQGFNYQAIARDVSGNAITNHLLPVRITIQSDSLSGTTFWIEEHNSVTTNSFGLFNLIIGKGEKKSGSTKDYFSDIEWTVTPKFIKTEIDYGGWKNMGSSRLWAVPYSMVSGDLAGPLKKLAVTGQTSNMEEALFEVKNKNGQTVFAVYNEGVRIYVDDGITKGATKGGFAIGGFGSVKTPSQEYFRVTRDSTRVYLNDTGAKATKGGFAIGGFDPVKGGIQDFLTVSTDSVRIFINTNQAKGTAKGGFAIGGFDPVKAGNEEYLRVTRDSTRVYLNDTGAKGTKGGFAIGGFENLKGKGQEYLRITDDSTRINIKEPAKGTKGGFAIGSFTPLKGTNTSFTSLTPENYFIGHEAGMENTTGKFNSFFGYNAGRSNKDGVNNIFIGRKSGYSNIDGGFNLFIGDSAGYNNTSGYINLFLGYGAGTNNTIGYLNTSIGNYAGAYNTTGWQNINLGYMAGFSNTFGNRNIFVGAGAGQSNTEGQANVMVGNLAGAGCKTGRNNVYIGAYAGRRDSVGSYNVFLGSNAGQGEKSSNRLLIANNNIWPLIYGEFDNGKVVISGDSASNIFRRTFYVDGDAGGQTAWSNDSDRKLKHDIVTIPDALQKILQLRGVNFLWNEPKENMAGLQMGFIGQEAAEIIPEVVSVKNDRFSMQYAPITALLVEGMKEQQKQIESQKKEIDELKALVEHLLLNQPLQGDK